MELKRWTEKKRKELVEGDMNGETEANILVIELRVHLTRCAKRKAALDCSVPSEIQLMIFAPKWRAEKLGAQGSQEKLEDFSYQDLCTNMEQPATTSKGTPRQGSRRHKTYGKIRILHVKRPLWTPIYGIWFDKDKDRQRHYTGSKGSLKRKRGRKQ